MKLFERYLTVWVFLAIVTGVILGSNFSAVFEAIASLEFAHVNIVVAVLIWVMIYPMMIEIDFSSLKEVGNKP